MPSVWSPSERLAWSPPLKLNPAQWSETHAVIPDNGVNPEPGPLNLDRTPYLRGILETIAEPGVIECVFLKPTQVGFSTLGRLLIGFWIDVDPGPAMILLPDEPTAKEWLEEDVVPTLEQTPRLQRYRLTAKKANKETAIRLTSMRIFAAWATSPSRLARRPIRYLLCDEVDKYPAFSGRESDPISLARKRLSNFRHKARTLIGSTPTTRLGPIWTAFEGCGDKRHYQVPCPTCGAYQRLTWPQVKWEPAAEGETRHAHANRIQIDKAAWYECCHCGAKIHDLQKPRMLRLGAWASEGQTVAASNEIGQHAIVSGPRSRSSRIGFHISSIYSPWLDFSQLASEWIIAQAALENGNVAPLMDFMNSRLAEAFEQQTKAVKLSVVQDKVNGAPPPMIVPKWAKALIATADTQGTNEKDGWFPFVVRAWGFGFRSQLVRYGIAHSFGELMQLTIAASYQIDGTRQQTMPTPLLIDSGGPRNNDVWGFGQTHRNRVIVTKGSDHSLPSIVSRRKHKAHNLIWWLLDPEKTKDLLARLISDPDPTKWQVHNQTGSDYCNQVTAEHKIFDRKLKREIWVKKSSGIPNHFLDCEAEQCAAAFEAGMGIDEPDELPPNSPAENAGTNPLTNYRGKW